MESSASSSSSESAGISSSAAAPAAAWAAAWSTAAARRRHRQCEGGGGAVGVEGSMGPGIGKVAGIERGGMAASAAACAGWRRDGVVALTKLMTDQAASASDLLRRGFCPLSCQQQQPRRGRPGMAARRAAAKHCRTTSLGPPASLHDAPRVRVRGGAGEHRPPHLPWRRAVATTF